MATLWTDKIVFHGSLICIMAHVYLVHGVLYLTPTKEFSVRVGIQNPTYVDCNYQSDLSKYDECYNDCFGKNTNPEMCKSFTWDSDQKTCYFCKREIDDDGILANKTMRWVGHRVRRYIDRCPINIPSPPA